jgi:peptidoglycan/LPS O-acetylase OafA/YrhL
MYLRSFDYFRAVSIIFIVIGHTYGVSGWKIDGFWDRTVANLISGGTSLFVFISGFLFHHVFYPRFHYATFLKKKFRNVYVPYLILSVVPVCVALYTKIPFGEFYFGPSDSFFDQVIKPIFLYYWYGGVLVYWYIPFIMAMFLISPLFIKFIEISTRKKIYVIFWMTFLSLFLHRPINNWSVIQSVVYFSPVYMFGILCSMEREWIYEKFHRRDGLVFLAALFLAVAQAAVMGTSGNLQKAPFDYNGVDIALLQKMLPCVFFMVFLHRFEDREWRVLKQIAASSFSIYFLHGWFIFAFWLARDLYADWRGFGLLPVFSGLIIWLSWGTASLVRKRWPDRSRMIIGW